MPVLLLLGGVLLGATLALAAVTGAIWLQTARALRRSRPGVRPGRPRRAPASRTTGKRGPLMQQRAYPNRLGLDPDPPQLPHLHLQSGVWSASCPTCGYRLATSRSQTRAERRGRRRTCPICREEG